MIACVHRTCVCYATRMQSYCAVDTANQCAASVVTTLSATGDCTMPLSAQSRSCVLEDVVLLRPPRVSSSGPRPAAPGVTAGLNG